MKLFIKNLIILTILYSFTFVLYAQNNQSELLSQTFSKYDLKTSQVKSNKFFWIELGLKNKLAIKNSIQFITLGLRKEYIGLDLRFSRGNTTHGEMTKLAMKNYNDPNSYNPEIDLIRNSKDKWSFWSIEPGISVANQFFSDYLSSFTERVRAGIALGRFNDDQNNIPFKSYVFNAEATIIYPLKNLPNWTINASVNWNTGMIIRKYDNAELEEYGLPVSWLGTSVAMEYYF